MTFESINVRGLSDDDNALANRLLKQLDDRAPRNLLRSSFYDGKRAMRQISTVVPPQYHRLGLVLGWSAKAVDALARRCNIDAFTWADGDLDSLGMDELVDDNQLLSELSGGITNALTHGTSFLINTVGSDGEPDSLIHAKDALNATGDWNARTRQMDNLVSVLERKENKVTSFALYLNGRTVTVTKGSTGWTSERQDHAYGVPVEPLVYKPQTRTFGYSRISRPIMGLQDAAVRALIRMEGHMDIWSYPELILLGADGSVFKDEAGNTLPVWQARMAAIKGVPDDQDAPDSLARADIKHIPASSPEPHLAQLNALAKMFAREASLPDAAVAITDMANPTSAEAYDASQYELVAEAEGAVDDFSRPIARSVRRGLAILNRSEQDDDWRSIRPKWRNPRFESRAQAADAGTKQISAVSWLGETEVGLELLGLTDDQIKRALADKRRMGGSAALSAVADAVAQTQTEDAASIRAKADAMGVLIRSGVRPEDAAKAVGFDRLTFTGAVPVSLRLPEADAQKLEGGDSGSVNADPNASA